MKILQKISSILLTSLLAVECMANTNIKLEDINGEFQNMQHIIGQGQWTVVNVWSPSCSFCVEELPHMLNFAEKHKDNINVLGVTLDFPTFEYGKIELTKKFIEKNPLNYPVYFADHDLASELIGIRLVGIPLIAIFNPEGKAVARWPGTIEIEEIESFIKNYVNDNDPLSADF